MKATIYILLLLLISTNIHGENFIIDKYRCSNYMYTSIIKHLFQIHNDKKEISLFAKGDTIHVSYANKKQVLFYKISQSSNVFIKKRGKYIINLFIEKNKYDTIIKAYFIVVRKNKEIAEISLTHI